MTPPKSSSPPVHRSSRRTCRISTERCTPGGTSPGPSSRSPYPDLDLDLDLDLDRVGQQIARHDRYGQQLSAADRTLAHEHATRIQAAFVTALHGVDVLLLPVVHPRMGTPISSIDSQALLEPPGFLMLNYGRGSPLVSLAAHLAYGALVGGLAAASR